MWIEQAPGLESVDLLFSGRPGRVPSSTMCRGLASKQGGEWAPGPCCPFKAPARAARRDGGGGGSLVPPQWGSGNRTGPGKGLVAWGWELRWQGSPLSRWLRSQLYCDTDLLQLTGWLSPEKLQLCVLLEVFYFPLLFYCCTLLVLTVDTLKSAVCFYHKQALLFGPYRALVYVNISFISSINPSDQWTDW